MNGVEILTSMEVVTKWAPNWTVFWVTAIIVFFIFLVIGILWSCDQCDSIPTIICSVTGIIIGCILGVTGADALHTPIAHETQYQVIISDEVSMTEFYEHYEMIDQDGKIFTVREKTNESN